MLNHIDINVNTIIKMTTCKMAVAVWLLASGMPIQ